MSRYLLSNNAPHNGCPFLDRLNGCVNGAMLSPILASVGGGGGRSPPAVEDGIGGVAKPMLGTGESVVV